MDEALDNDAIALVKEKRTKRQRLRSLSKEGDLGIDKAFMIIDGSSPLTSSVEYYDREGTITTEEEVDMANCLILLARGHCPMQPSVKLSATADDGQEYGRFTSRKYLEADTGQGKIGYYVYECKTCNRTFPSFQALGGHRASHKKPKSTPNPTVAILLRDEEGQPGESKKYSSLSLPIGNNSNGGNSYGHSTNAMNNLRKQGKAHECSICGSEFSSGQALGGHMRRHRAPPMTPQIGISRPSDSAATTTISFDLDLNLPVPEDRNAGTVFFLKQHERRSPRPALGFSSPTMVDCHY